MHLLITVAVVLQVISAVAIIVLVLLQHGKGADMGAAFGGGASGSLFGATGSANFLSRSTAVASTIFFCATLALTFGGQVLDSLNNVMQTKFCGGYYFGEIAGKRRKLFEALGVPVPDAEPEKEQDYDDEEETEF